MSKFGSMFKQQKGDKVRSLIVLDFLTNRHDTIELHTIDLIAL